MICKKINQARNHYRGPHIHYLYKVTHHLYWRPELHMVFLSLISRTTGATGESGTANPSGAPEFTHNFKWGSCCSVFRFLYSACLSNILYAIVLSVRHRFYSFLIKERPITWMHYKYHSVVLHDTLSIF